MKAGIRQKRFLSALLLILYGFIITPAALWHSHACGQEVCKDAGSPGKQPADAADSCDICKHVYATHIAGESGYVHISAVVYRQYCALITRSIPYIFTGHADTRGSPAPVA